MEKSITVLLVLWLAVSGFVGLSVPPEKGELPLIIDGKFGKLYYGRLLTETEEMPGR